ncbi:hypothetical protein BGX34_002549 [Mortierella sp. NVP85]|nr:hypothetical protein BGX34_002549 [Mortierella sp. NVP85]
MDYATTNRLYEKYKDVGYIGNYVNNIQRYIDHVHQFASLSSVKFSIEGLAHVRQYGYDSYTSDPTRGIEETERDGFFRDMVEFVRQHIFIHKNVLRNVEVPRSTEIYGTDQHSIPDVYYAIQSLLPSFQNSRTIHTGRIELLARPTDTCPSLLESITVLPRSGNLQDKEISELLSRHPPFLPRYRSLKHLTSESLGPDMFQWAVLEKKQKEAEHQQESIVGRHLSSWQHGHHTSDLVRLQSISISKSKQPPIDQELNDIAFAFSDSLEEWNVEDGIEGGYKVQEDDTVITHGQGWDLPRLRRLSLKMSGVRLLFDMDGLERCRALESLAMHDDMITYRNQDIRSWSIVCLPHLKKLDLEGSPASHFNTDSLHQSPCLEELTLKMAPMPIEDDDYCQYLMLSLDELEDEDSDTEGVNDDSSGMPGSSQEYQSIGKRPLYTWDWHHSNLRKLNLAAMFALMFDFRWLQHLPNLQSLRLDISSPVDVPCRRHITLKDLLRRELQQASDESGSGEILSDRFISLLTMESIALYGDWIFEEKVMETLCLTVAPNLTSFGYEGRYADLSLRECIALSRKMPRLKKMKLQRLLFWENPYRLGLEREKNLRAEQLKECVEFVIDGYRFYLAPRCGPSNKSG